MLFKTHLAGALFIALIYIHFTTNTFINNLIFVILCLFATLLPDLDTPTSKLGRKLKIIGWFSQHRGLHHTIWMGIVYAGIFYMLTNNAFFTTAVFIGFTTHLLLDALTKQGIKPFLPIPLTLKGVIKTGGFTEIFIFILLCLSNIFFLFFLSYL